MVQDNLNEFDDIETVDVYAAFAMIGLLACRSQIIGNLIDSHESVAKEAYEMADALLKQKERRRILKA